METDQIDAFVIEESACATSDLTARLHVELSQAQAELAIAVARTAAAVGTGHAVPAAVVADRLLAEQRIEVLRGLLDGMPGVTTWDLEDPDDNRRASA